MNSFDFLDLDMCLDGNLSLGLQPLTGANDHEFSFSDIFKLSLLALSRDKSLFQDHSS